MFSKDNMEHIAQVKQGHVEWWRHIPKLFEDSRLLSFGHGDASKASFKTIVTLFLGKIKYLIDIDFNI